VLYDLTQVINDPGEFSLYIVQDTGVIQACKEEEHPLMTRLKLGPNEVRIILYCSALCLSYNYRYKGGVD